jgi:hypothetical protein
LSTPTTRNKNFGPQQQDKNIKKRVVVVVVAMVEKQF